MNRRNPAADQLRNQQPDHFALDRKAMVMRLEAVATQQARERLEERGIVARSVAGPERREKLRAYMRSLKQLPNPEPRAWAYEIVSRAADGYAVPSYALAMAREVVEMDSGVELGQAA